MSALKVWIHGSCDLVSHLLSQMFPLIESKNLEVCGWDPSPPDLFSATAPLFHPNFFFFFIYSEAIKRH